MEACSKGDGEGEGFVRLEGVKFPNARNSILYSNMTLEECGRECLKSCNCTGYANVYVDEMGRGCIAWYGELRDMRHYNSRQDFYLRVDAVELAADAQKNAKVHSPATKSTLVFLIVPIVVEKLLASLCFYYMWRRNAKRKGQKQKQRCRQRLDLDSARSLSNLHKDSPNSSGESGNTGLTLFELSTVIAATDQLSSANKLGLGGFGPVYKMWELWRDGKGPETVDSCINDSCPANEVIRCIQVGLLCMQDNTEDRPSMSNKVFMLNNETVLPSPKKS